MNAAIRPPDRRIEIDNADNGLVISGIIPARQDSPIPTIDSLWTIRRPTSPTISNSPAESAYDDL